MTKKQRVLAVIERLKKEYPEASCTLAYEDAWQLLVSVRLAAQCTDARVDQITPLLYEKFPSVAALAAADPSEIEAIVRPCGLGPSKARDISKCMRVLHEQYDDQVPTTFEELLALPGVGRKSANLVMGDVFGQPASAVMTKGMFSVDVHAALGQMLELMQAKGVNRLPVTEDGHLIGIVSRTDILNFFLRQR